MQGLSEPTSDVVEEGSLMIIGIRMAGTEKMMPMVPATCCASWMLLNAAPSAA